MQEINLPKVRIYSDGSTKGKDQDSPGGYGTIVQYMSDDNKTLKTEEYSEGFKVTTNNRMELMGVIIGLESLKEPCEVIIYSDSKYVVDAFNKDWTKNWIKNGWKLSTGEPVKNKDLWERLLAAKEPHSCKFVWLKGHNGHADNERCDYLAQASASGVKFIKGEDGKLKEEITTEQPLTPKQKPTVQDIFKAYVSMAKKDYVINFNGVKLIIDEDGDVFPGPTEDIQKSKEVMKLLKKINEDESFVKMFKTILLDNSFSTFFSSTTLDNLSKFIFTADETIPKFQISVKE